MAEKPDSTTPDGKGRLNPRRKLHRIILRVTGYLLLLLAGVAVGGFLHFADAVEKLAPPENLKADAIVVLTGGSQRIDQAIGLLESGTGRRLLISGVHPGTSAARIRGMTRAPQSLFDCCIDVGYDAIDTIGNALETAKWVRRHGYTDVLVVTNNYHMPRSLFELHRVDPRTHYIAYPIVNSDMKGANWATNPNVMRAMLSEYLKLAGAEVRAYFQPPGPESLRSGRVNE